MKEKIKKQVMEDAKEGKRPHFVNKSNLQDIYIFLINFTRIFYSNKYQANKKYWNWLKNIKSLRRAAKLRTTWLKSERDSWVKIVNICIKTISIFNLNKIKRLNIKYFLVKLYNCSIL